MSLSNTYPAYAGLSHYSHYRRVLPMTEQEIRIKSLDFAFAIIGKSLNQASTLFNSESFSLLPKEPVDPASLFEPYKVLATEIERYIREAL